MSELQPVLELKSIKKAFGKNIIHKGIDFTLHKGEAIGLLGASGTGKSVLLRSIIGLEFIDSGEVVFNGKRIDHISELDYLEVRKKISYSFQSGALFDSKNVFDNISFPLKEHTNMTWEEMREKVKEILSLIDLDGKEELMPSDLSGGMQKRVGMARSMILEPEIILYDEPTAGLDPNNTLNILKIMDKLKDRGVTSIFVTHDIPAALKVCDRIVIIHEGRIGFNGTPKETMKSDDPIVKKFLINALNNK